jgi:hypothetical protein
MLPNTKVPEKKWKRLTPKQKKMVKMNQSKSKREAAKAQNSIPKTGW